MKLCVDRQRRVTADFLYSWLAYHNIDLKISKTIVEKLGNRQIRFITDEELTSKIISDFKRFKTSGLTLNEHFGINIVFVSKIKDHFRVKNDSLKGELLFVWRPGRNLSEMNSVNYRVPIEKLSSVTPIEMNLRDIFRLYNINDSFESEFELEDKYDLAIDWYQTDKAQWKHNRDYISHWRSPDLPGFRASGAIRIKMAKDADNKTYWIPPSTPSPTEYQCTKFPGLCRYQARDTATLKRHMKSCISDTKLVTKKVT